jgi:hypothetical protein
LQLLDLLLVRCLPEGNIPKLDIRLDAGRRGDQQPGVRVVAAGVIDVEHRPCCDAGLVEAILLERDLRTEQSQGQPTLCVLATERCTGVRKEPLRSHQIPAAGGDVAADQQREGGEPARRIQLQRRVEERVRVTPATLGQQRQRAERSDVTAEGVREAGVGGDLTTRECAGGRLLEPAQGPECRGEVEVDPASPA